MKFAPTWLYVKQHRVTGLKYFGKTIRDPFKYNGSGRYWKQHIKIHGKDIDTIWCELFDNEQHLVEFAEFFSKHYNIVNATDSFGKKIWANEIPENGLQGGQNAGFPSPLKGIKQPHVSLALKGKSRPEHSKIMSGRKQTEDHVKKRADSLRNHIRTAEHCAAISKSKKGVPNPKVSIALKNNPNLNRNKGRKLKTYKCLYCDIETTGGNLKRWHNENCRERISND